jgi:hypothetical protein
LWISYVTAEPGKSNELGMHMAADGAKIYDGLVDDGLALSWGVAQAINHYPGDNWTHMEFVNFKDWAAVNEFVTRFMGAQMAMSPEARAADAAKWDDLTVHGSHYDMVGRHAHVAASGKAPAYISLSSFKTQPGVDESAVRDMYRKWRAPMMDKLLADGAGVGHGAFTPYLHGPGSGTSSVTAWYTIADLGKVDAVDAAVDADAAARTDEQKAAWGADMQKSFERPDDSNHTDRILVVLHYKSAGPPSE